MLLHIHRDDLYLYNIAHLQHLCGVLDKAIADLGDMDQTIIMDTDINKSTEIDYISHRPLQNHPLFEIFQGQYIGFQNGAGQLVPRVSAGLLQKGGNILQGRQADP